MNEGDLMMRDLDEELNKDGLHLPLSRCGQDVHWRCGDRDAQELRNVTDVSRVMQVMVKKERQVGKCVSWLQVLRRRQWTQVGLVKCG